MLGASPIIVKVEHGLYRIIGRRTADGAVGDARRRLREKIAPALAPQQAPLQANEFALRVTEASLRNEQYQLPRPLQEDMRGRRFSVFDDVGDVIGNEV